MQKLGIAMICLVLAACGVDGAPEPVEPERPRNGITFGGSASIGISG
ncbi:MAG: argininosuccinate lyase [Pseudomonadota bacterium]